MWLMTKYGFYSIVCKDGRYHIRARDKGHLEELQKHWHLGEILHNAGTDYQYRCVVQRDMAMQVIAWLGEQIDYDNFKGAVARKWGFKSVYHAFLETVWVGGRDLCRRVMQGGQHASAKQGKRRNDLDR